MNPLMGIHPTKKLYEHLMFEVRAKSTKETDILMYGSISEWGRIRAEDLFRAIANAKANGYEKVNLKINSPGGSIFEGIACISQLQHEDIEIHACVEGMAASMASAMLQGAHRRKMVKGSRLMIHQGAGGVMGSANQIREYADLLESLNKTLADIYAKRTKKEPKWILENWMAEGRNTWFTAEQALKEGLIDEIVDGKIKPLEKEEASLIEMAAHYSQQLDTTETEMNKTELIALLGLSANATDAEIKAAMQAMKAKADTATAPPAAAAATQQTASATPAQPVVMVAEDKAKLVEAVMEIAKGRGLKEDDKQYTAIKKVAEFDIKAAMDLLPGSASEAKPEVKPDKPISLNELIAAIKGEGTSSAKGDTKNWTLSDWEAKDSGGLLKMIQEKPGEYAKLFAAQHGYTPSEAELKDLVK